jgi:hypothetical protein
MAQGQAQVDDARRSRLMTDLATKQSQSVMIFTIFTVIFMPLSFFTGLFGMNTDEWQSGTYLSLSTIGSIALPGSALIIAVALVAGFSQRLQGAVRYAFSVPFQVVGHILGRLFQPWARRQRRRLRERAVRDQARAWEMGWRTQRPTYDFWTGLKKQRVPGHSGFRVDRNTDLDGSGRRRTTWRSRESEY